MLPEFADPLLHQQLAEHGIHGLKPVAPLCMGTSNQNFLATSGGESWVLRVNSRHMGELCPRQREVASWRLAAAQGLAPELRFVSHDYRYYLSRYIHTEPAWHKRYHTEPQTVRLLNELVNALRLLPKTVKVITPQKQWQHYQQLLHASAPHLNDEQRIALNQLVSFTPRIEEAITALAQRPQLGFCHRDLNPHNLLLDNNRLVCIDFEYSCVSDIRIELATLLACHQLSDDQRRRLLHLQAEVIDSVSLQQATTVYWAYTACWALLMWQKNRGCAQWISQALTQLNAQH